MSRFPVSFSYLPPQSDISMKLTHQHLAKSHITLEATKINPRTVSAVGVAIVIEFRSVGKRTYADHCVSRSSHWRVVTARMSCTPPGGGRDTKQRVGVSTHELTMSGVSSLRAAAIVVAA
jgi:hypothetical protein